MDILKRPLIVLILASAMTGCYSEFDPDVTESPVLCINDVVSAGEPVEVTLTHTWQYSDGPGDIDVTDAEVVMWVNGRPCRDMSYRPAPGDTLLFEARSERYGAAKGQTLVPHVPAVSLTAIDCRPNCLQIYDSSDEEAGIVEEMAFISMPMVLRLRITDPGPGNDYFSLAEFRMGVSAVEYGYGYIDYNAEPLFSEHISVLESVFGADAYGFTVFSDRQFSGKSYDLSVVLDSFVICVPTDINECSMSVVLASLSESLYKWYIYDWRTTNGVGATLGDIGLAEGLSGFSNVSSGAGLICARSEVQVSIDLMPYITQALE